MKILLIALFISFTTFIGCGDNSISNTTDNSTIGYEISTRIYSNDSLNYIDETVSSNIYNNYHNYSFIYNSVGNPIYDLKFVNHSNRILNVKWEYYSLYGDQEILDIVQPNDTFSINFVNYGISAIDSNCYIRYIVNK